MEDNLIENLDQIDGSQEAVVPEVDEAIPAPVDAEVEEVEEQHEEEQPKKKPGSQRAREALQREREERIRLQARLEVLEALAGNKPVHQATQDAGLRPPVESDYQTYEEYQEAVLEYKVEKKLAEREQKRSIEEQKRNENSTWENKVKAGVQKFGEEFLELFENVQPPPDHIKKLIVGPDVPVEVVHWLLSNPSEHNKLSSMSVIQAAKYLGQIEAKLSDPPKKTKAPEPIKPLSASVKVSPKKNEMMETY